MLEQGFAAPLLRVETRDMRRGVVTGIRGGATDAIGGIVITMGIVKSRVGDCLGRPRQAGVIDPPLIVAADTTVEVEAQAALLRGTQLSGRYIGGEFPRGEGEGVTITLVIRPAILGRMVMGIRVVRRHEFVTHEVDHQCDLLAAQGIAKSLHAGARLAVSNGVDHRSTAERGRIEPGEIARRWSQIGSGKGAAIAGVAVADITAKVPERSAALMGGRLFQGFFLALAGGAMKLWKTNSLTSASCWFVSTLPQAGISVPSLPSRMAA